MERHFILDKFNTWYDWRLILTAKNITPPEPKTNYVNIDGMSGSLDLSESLTGEVCYQDRTISASFWTDEGNRKDRERLLSEIRIALHGKKIKIIEPDDPDHYFYGRVVIKSVKNTLAYAEFTIEATCDPWRYDINETVRTIVVDNADPTNVVINYNGVKTVCPEIAINGSVFVTIDDATSELTDGSYKITNLKLRHGATVLGVSGSGSMSLTYREATL